MMLRHLFACSQVIICPVFALLVAVGVLHGEVVVDFEDLALAPGSSAPGDATQAPLVSRGVSFNRTWNTEFDCCPGAWAASNQADLTTAGFGNAYAAYHAPDGGGAADSPTFAVAFNAAENPATITLPAATSVQGMFVTNTTYAYLAIVEGRDTAESDTPQFVKGAFDDGDWFRLDILGQDVLGQETGSIPFYLADYRDGQRLAVAGWTWVDLSGLGDRVKTLGFQLSSTDNGMFGMNTPAYFAIDNVAVDAVPEPSGLALLLASCAAVALAGRDRPSSRA
jgi:hypothetical protein